MAFDVKILGVKLDLGKYSFYEAGGWIGDACELRADSRFRNVSHSPGYMDYMGVLTVEEALAMAKNCYDRVAARRSPEAQAEWGDYRPYDSFAERLRGASFVLVHIFEWESGF
jgi:hypothetical protein